jgi:hypothetical protein
MDFINLETPRGYKGQGQATRFKAGGAAPQMLHRPATRVSCQGITTLLRFEEHWAYQMAIFALGRRMLAVKCTLWLEMISEVVASVV